MSFIIHFIYINYLYSIHFVCIFCNLSIFYCLIYFVCIYICYIYTRLSAFTILMPRSFFLLYQCYWFIFLFLYCKSQPKAFTSSTELINLCSMMFAAISPSTSFVSILYKMLALKAFIDNKNLMLETFDLATDSHITIPKLYRSIN